MFRVQKIYSVIVIGSILFLLPVQSHAQDSIQSISDKLDTLFAELDELFIKDSSKLEMFQLVDSMLAVTEVKFHAAMIRLSYLGQVTSAGRAQDVNQFGLFTGFSYFHPSGLYADINGFLNSSYEPQYFLTVPSLGYFQTFFKYWNVNLSHDFFIYNDTLNSQPFSNSINASNFLNLKNLELGVDYSYLYGKRDAHRLTAIGNIRKKWRFNGFIQSVSVLPGATVQWGNADVIYWRQSDSPVLDLIEIIQNGNYPPLQRNEYLYLARLLLQERYAGAFLLLRRNNFSNDQIESAINTFNESQIQQENIFGLMNYSIQLPVNISFSSLNLMIAYQHNFPVPLPNEMFEYNSNGFLSLSLSYFIFKPRGWNESDFWRIRW